MNTWLNRLSWLTLSIFLFFYSTAYAQQPQLIKEPTLGVEFSAPSGWTYQRNDLGYVMGHNSIPGIILVMSSPYKSMAQLKQAAYEGISEEGGTMLQLVGELEQFGTNGLAGNYQGTMNWEQAKAYSIGLINPTGGVGVSCMIISSNAMFTPTHIAILKKMASSFNFSKPEIADAVKEWDDWFKTPGGCRLKYLTSSGSTDYNGGYTGGSSEETIDLCPNGIFGFSSNNFYSSSSDAGSAYVAGDDGGQGKWELTFNGTNPVLVLNFNDGSTNEYELTYVDSKTYLNDYRYFVLFNDEGPGCH